jgi:hypothetical protein
MSERYLFDLSDKHHLSTSDNVIFFSWHTRVDALPLDIHKSMVSLYTTHEQLFFREKVLRSQYLSVLQYGSPHFPLISYK